MYVFILANYHHFTKTQGLYVKNKVYFNSFYLFFELIHTIIFLMLNRTITKIIRLNTDFIFVMKWRLSDKIYGEITGAFKI